MPGLDISVERSQVAPRQQTGCGHCDADNMDRSPRRASLRCCRYNDIVGVNISSRSQPITRLWWSFTRQAKCRLHPPGGFGTNSRAFDHERRHPHPVGH